MNGCVRLLYRHLCHGYTIVKKSDRLLWKNANLSPGYEFLLDSGGFDAWVRSIINPEKYSK
jgi:hypothetical protein